MKHFYQLIVRYQLSVISYLKNRFFRDLNVVVPLFILLFFAVGCEKDELNNTENELQDFPFSKHTMLHKSSEFIEDKIGIKNAINRISKGFSNNTEKNFEGISSPDFKIFTENITYVYSPEDSTETYSFYIE